MAGASAGPGGNGGDEYWWATLDILAGREEKKPRKDIMADVEDWLNKITAKIAKQRRIALEQPVSKQADGDEAVVRKTSAKVIPKTAKATRKDTSSASAAAAIKEEPEFQYLESTFGDHIEIECIFNNPRIRSRLEKLMGSNVVRITDRKYMTKLQERIKEDHLENQRKRIKEREKEEVEREKKLILEGKISMEDAPKELKNHPVCKINQITKKILEEKKAKMKNQGKASGSKTSGKKAKEAERSKQDDENSDKGDNEAAGGDEDEKLNEDAGNLSIADDETEDIAKGFMFSKEEYEKLKYESPLVKKLKEVHNVEDMYALAEEIVGPLKHRKTSK